MYYPIFEYTLLMYIIADYLNVAVHWKKGVLSIRYYKVFKICFPIMIICVALFRLIFVMIAYIDVRGHIFGFLLLQIALVMIACLNVWFIVEARIEYRCFRNHTKKLCLCTCSVTYQSVC